MNLLNILLLQGSPAFNVNVAAELLKQGPLITALIIAIGYFYQRQKQQETAIQAAADKLEKYMAEDREMLLSALNNNTKAFDNNARVMEDIELYLKTKYAANN